MMVYILCVDGSSGAEELHLVRERASAMRSERETPNGCRGNCRLNLALLEFCEGQKPAGISVSWLKFAL